MMYKSKAFLLTLLLTVFAATIVVLYGSQLITFFSLETLQCYAGYLRVFSNQHYYLTVAFYIVFGIGAVVLFLPVVTLYMLTAGFLFGPFEGACYAVIGVTIGAICAFLMIRATVGPWVERYERRLVTINRFIEAYGFYALTVLRMSHLVPFFLLNIAASLMPISLHSFAAATFIGVIPGALLFSWTGQYLCTIRSVWDLISVNTIIMVIVCAMVLLVIIALGSYLMRKNHVD